MSRDRGGGYGEAVAKARPGAVQIADRWRLMKNASAAFLDASASPCVQSAARSVRLAEAAARKLHESGTYVRLLTPSADLLTALSRRLRSAVWSLICWTFFRSPLGGPAWSSIARLWQLLV